MFCSQSSAASAALSSSSSSSPAAALAAAPSSPSAAAAPSPAAASRTPAASQSPPSAAAAAQGREAEPPTGATAEDAEGESGDLSSAFRPQSRKLPSSTAETTPPTHTPSAGAVCSSSCSPSSAQVDFSSFFSEIFAHAEQEQQEQIAACLPPAADEGGRESEGTIAAAQQLLVLSPLDGRYSSNTQSLKKYFSSFAFVAARARVMGEWMICLSAAISEAGENCSAFPPLDPQQCSQVRQEATFSLSDAMRAAELEKETRHDLKAIEYVLREKLEKASLARWTPLLHFGATSEDVNNCAHALATKSAFAAVLRPAMSRIVALLQQLALEHADVPLLARTHGQPASPTTFGKEMANFCYRLREALATCERVEVVGKYNGATGCFNALAVAYPSINWPLVAEHFVRDRLGLEYLPFSTQVNPCDWLAALCDAVSRFNTILLDLSVDLWLYISRELVKLKVVQEEVGSSTMPHKVNPIDMENAEGNLQMANVLLRFFSAKLPTSRLQRDLSGSTVLRNVGVAFGYCVVAYSSLARGLNKISVDRPAMERELNAHWEVLAEPLQILMRKTGGKHAYEELKTLTRGTAASQEAMRTTMHTCVRLHAPLQQDAETLRTLAPATYTGLAASLAKSIAAPPGGRSAAPEGSPASSGVS